MPRGPRIDYPGLLHHVMVRGIERKKIFNEDKDYQDFLGRISKALEGSGAVIYAWVLMSNHIHLLIKIGKQALSKIMRRILTGYALAYNRKYRRAGYLYQGRYKSIICEEELYLLELVRYIHLNPLRAGIVKTLDGLDRYKWCGHRIIMGRGKFDCQDTEEILSRFGYTIGEARRKYREFVREGIKQGKRNDLTGGGLIRSLGGIGRAIISKLGKEKQMYDQRILGGGNFVEGILKKTETKEEKIPRINIDEVIKKICRIYNIKTAKLLNRKNQKGLYKIKSIVVNIGIDRLGISGSSLARKFGLTRSSISRLNKLGEVLIRGEESREIDLRKILGNGNSTN